jgi:hypothetical protein
MQMSSKKLSVRTSTDKTKRIVREMRLTLPEIKSASRSGKMRQDSKKDDPILNLKKYFPDDSGAQSMSKMLACDKTEIRLSQFITLANDFIVLTRQEMSDLLHRGSLSLMFMQGAHAQLTRLSALMCSIHNTHCRNTISMIDDLIANADEISSSIDKLLILLEE